MPRRDDRKDEKKRQPKAPSRRAGALPPKAETGRVIRLPSRVVGYFVQEREIQTLIGLATSWSVKTEADSPSGWTFASLALSGCFDVVVRCFGTWLPGWTDAAMLGTTALAFAVSALAFVRSRLRKKATSAVAEQLLVRLKEIVENSDREVPIP